MWAADFEVDSHPYEIVISGGGSVFDLTFYDKTDGYRIDRTGHAGRSAITVFATVMAATREFIKLREPELLGIISSKMDGERGRAYARMLRLSKKDLTDLGYHVFTQESASATRFWLEKAEPVPSMRETIDMVDA